MRCEDADPSLGLGFQDFGFRFWGCRVSGFRPRGLRFRILGLELMLRNIFQLYGSGIETTGVHEPPNPYNKS